jgi:mono/diheme cytochrome c family protein
MKTPSIGTLSFGLVGFAAITLLAIGSPQGRAEPPPATPATPPPPSVSAGGFTLAATAVDLPEDDQQYPAGPHAEVINANCTSCHSASMALSQPALSEDQWKAIVTKMRETYKAPVADKDVPAIIAYLTGLSARQTANISGAASAPAPALAQDRSGGSG